MEISNQSKEYRLSVYLLFGLSIFIAGFLFWIIGSNSKMFDSKYTLYMFMPNIEGLNTGNYVTLSGLKVGVVGEIELSERAGQQGLTIELNIDENFQHRIRETSQATIKTMGILGDKFVDITLGDLNTPVLEEGMFITGNPALDANALISTATSTMKNLDGTLKNSNIITNEIIAGSGVLNKLIMDKETGEKFASISTNVSDVSKKMNSGDGSLSKFVNDAGLYQNLESTAKNLNETTGKINSGQGSLGKLVNSDQFYSQISSVAGQTELLLKSLNKGEGTAGKFLKDSTLYIDLLKLTKSLNTLTKDIQENPKKYINLEVF